MGYAEDKFCSRSEMPESKRENDNEYQRINSKWVVYYLERGVRTTELFFDSEEEACDYILKSFR